VAISASPDIALQLYSIKEETQADFANALELTARAGYQGVEFAGYFGRSAEEMKTLLARHRLKAVSTHAGLDRLRTAFAEELDYAVKVGYALIVCPYSPCETKAQVLETAAFLETCARNAAERGITIGYHNHAHEFVRFDGKFALDILLEAAPSVTLQPDVYWIAAGGADPVAYLGPLQRAGRICAVHAKEMSRTGKENAYIGQGRIDFPALARLCPPQTLPWIVEQEEYSTGHADGIAQSYRGLRAVFEPL
jgi:sugar phosphate isomerase/epimerase